MIIKDYKIIRRHFVTIGDSCYERIEDDNGYLWHRFHAGFALNVNNEEKEQLEAEFQSTLKTKEVVINSSGDGLNFTHSEIMRYAELAGLPLKFVRESLGIDDDDDEYCYFEYSLNGEMWHIDTDVSRECKHLIEIIKKMNGICSRDTYKIISIPETTKYYIIYYDGDYESIKEDIGQKTWD